MASIVDPAALFLSLKIERPLEPAARLLICQCGRVSTDHCMPDALLKQREHVLIFDPVAHLLPIPAGPHQPHPAQPTQRVRDSRLGHSQPARQRAQVQFPAWQGGEDAHPTGIAECAKQLRRLGGGASMQSRSTRRASYAQYLSIYSDVYYYRPSWQHVKPRERAANGLFSDWSLGAGSTSPRPPSALATP